MDHFNICFLFQLDRQLIGIKKLMEICPYFFVASKSFFKRRRNRHINLIWKLSLGTFNFLGEFGKGLLHCFLDLKLFVFNLMP